MVDQPTQRRLEQMMPVPNMETISDLNREFAGAIGEVSQVYMEGMREFQSELFRFAAYRADDNSESGRNLFQVHNFADLVDVQQEWIRRFTEQYMSEAERLLHLMQRTTQSAWTPFFSYEKHLAQETERSFSKRSEDACDTTRKNIRSRKRKP